MEEVAPKSYRQAKVETEWCPGASPGDEEMSPLHGVIRRGFLKEVTLKPRPEGDEPIK